MRVPLWLAGIYLTRLVLMWATGQSQEEAMVWPPDWQTVVSIPLGLAGAVGFAKWFKLDRPTDGGKP